MQSSSEDICELILSLHKCSLMKWRSISTCLIWSCLIGLCAILITTLLSQYKLTGHWIGNPSSVRSIRIHINLQTRCAIDRNTTFTLDCATIDSFLLIHVTRLPPTKEQLPEVDRNPQETLSNLHPCMPLHEDGLFLHTIGLSIGSPWGIKESCTQSLGEIL